MAKDNSFKPGELRVIEDALALFSKEVKKLMTKAEKLNLMKEATLLKETLLTSEALRSKVQETV